MANRLEVCFDAQNVEFKETDLNNNSIHGRIFLTNKGACYKSLLHIVLSCGELKGRISFRGLASCVSSVFIYF